MVSDMSEAVIPLDEVLSALPPRRQARIRRGARKLLRDIERDEIFLRMSAGLDELQRQLSALDRGVSILARDEAGHIVDLGEPGALDRLRALFGLDRAAAGP